MNWEKHIVRRTLEGAGDQSGAQLQFLLQRLEACPEALPAIVAAVEDMAEFQDHQAKALRAELHRRKGGAEIIELQK
ncbi:MAG: hypothetical protein PF480_02915 [Roseovarius sp.]|jgi:hypothetical protein|nr:hypothetical protein [Roseovarius sp.]